MLVPFNLAILGLAVAGAITPPECSAHARYLSSKAFTLVVNVTDPPKDFDPPVHLSIVTGIHVGAGHAELGTSRRTGRVFYQNGTVDEYNSAKSTVLTDDGQPPAPAGIRLTREDAGIFIGSLNIGPGTPGIRLSTATPIIFLLPETFFVCDDPLPYYAGKLFRIVHQTAQAADIPAKCVPVRLVPQCAELEALPDGAFANHDFALDSSCYENVSLVDWKYSSR
jgi:hypothetical protein